MSGFAKFLIEKWRNRDSGWNGAHGLPISAVAGSYYSTQTGSDPPSVEIDWEKLEWEIRALEAEFAAKRRAAP